MPSRGVCFVVVLVNGEPREIANGATIAELLGELKIESRFVAVERNFDLVPRAQHAQCILSPGDRLEVVTLVGGG